MVLCFPGGSTPPHLYAKILQIMALRSEFRPEHVKILSYKHHKISKAMAAIEDGT
jgi:hypothetical protein